MIDLTQYNLSDKADVQRLADALGQQLAADVLCPLAVQMNAEMRAHFFMFIIAGPVGAMCAAVGYEQGAAILKSLTNTLPLARQMNDPRTLN